MKLLEFQKKAVVDLEVGFESHNTQCLAFYTGAGKTNIFIEFITRYIKSNPTAKVGVSAYLTTEIRDQIEERFELFGMKQHVETLKTRSPHDWNNNIFVFNPQFIYQKEAQVKFDLLVIDESHAGLSKECKMIKMIRKNWCHEKTKTLLVSATPWDTLALKEFKDIPVLKRPLDQGFADSLVTDFLFHAEEAQIEFDPDDFSRSGDLKQAIIETRLSVIKSVCIGKMKRLLKAKKKAIGKKVLVVCPPGNSGDIAHTMANEFGGLAFLEEWSSHSTRLNLETFKTDKSIRFLFVVNKCQVGFDMADLDTVIDLTMSRNIRVLAQRIGRIARKNGSLDKNYFYVYDKSLIGHRLDWLVFTIIDFCLGNYDGWTTRTAKWRAVYIHTEYRRMPTTKIFSEIVKELEVTSAHKSILKIKYITGTKPNHNRSLDEAIKEAKQYESRTEMWLQNPALYKWFRLNFLDEMENIFPYRIQQGKWNEKTVIESMKVSPSRVYWRRNSKGAAGWVHVNKRQDLVEKYLPRSRSSKVYTEKYILELLGKIQRWSRIRSYAGVRRWMFSNGSQAYWKKKWEEIHDRPAIHGNSIPKGSSHYQRRKIRETA
jgi:superfamily II DNA or RNA helicase